MDRTRLFWFACIPARLGLVLLVYFFPTIAGYLAAGIGASMLYLYAANERQDAREGGGVTWWNDIRPLHGSLLLLGGVLAIRNNPWAIVPLGADVFLGMGSWLSLRKQ